MSHHAEFNVGLKLRVVFDGVERMRQSLRVSSAQTQLRQEPVAHFELARW